MKTQTCLEQIELSFGTKPQIARVSRVKVRKHRAQWWFQQMRLAVDRAMDWKPAPEARPEQTYLRLPKDPMPGWA